MCILGLGGKVTDTRAVTLDGTFSVSSTVELANDSCNLAWALQTRLPDYLTVVRPESSPGSTTGGVFGRVEVVNAKTAGAISQLTEHIASRGMSFATFRSSQETSTGSTGAETFTATGTLYASSSTPPISFEWVSQEFAELADKVRVHAATVCAKTCAGMWPETAVDRPLVHRCSHPPLHPPFARFALVAAGPGDHI